MNGTDCLEESLKYQKKVRKSAQKIKVVSVGESTDTLRLEEPDPIKSKT